MLEELSIHDVINMLGENWEKPKELLGISENYDESSVQITIYESCVVLICANIESGIKQIAKVWVEDYNKFVGASNANNSILAAVQDSYYSDKKSQNYREKIKKLHKDHNIPIDPECITNGLKNPKPETFTKFFKKTGEKNFLERINSGELSDLFSANSDERDPVKESILEKINLLKNEYVNPDQELIKPVDEEKKDLAREWTTFLEELMKDRNKVAHGMEAQITLNRVKVRNYIEKAEYFQYLTILSLYQILFDDYNKAEHTL